MSLKPSENLTHTDIGLATCLNATATNFPAIPLMISSFQRIEGLDNGQTSAMRQ